jgi:glycogen(starch) synthase
MRILHILDHSIPLHSGYTFRTAAILREQRALGWETFHLTSPKQGETKAMVEEIEGLRFHRTGVPTPASSGIAELRQIRAVQARIEQLAAELRPDILHAHSPVLNAIPAIRAGRKLGIPVVYEIRAFWEDAAVDHGTTTEGSLRYRATKALETWAIKRADHVFTICEGLRADIVGRGIPAAKVTVIPNAVDIESFQLSGDADEALARRAARARRQAGAGLHRFLLRLRGAGSAARARCPAHPAAGARAVALLLDRWRSAGSENLKQLRHSELGLQTARYLHRPRAARRCTAATTT